MQKLLIIKTNTSPKHATEVPALLDVADVAWLQLGEHNWADQYPYCPQVAFRIAHCGRALLLHFRVKENSIRALAERNNGRVWEDSCCELFLQPEEKGDYYNIECNCAGSLLIGCGPDRHDRERAPHDVLDSVDRWSSLGNASRPQQEGLWQWELALLIPVTALWRSRLESLDGLAARCNFYKCGDLLSQPHFLSWCPVETPKPDFHQPRFFGECLFAG